MSQAATLKCSGAMLKELCEENGWPLNEIVAYWSNELGWDMGATIDATSTQEEIEDWTNWTYLVNIEVA